MAVTCLSEQGAIKYGAFEFICDGTADLQQLPKKVTAGSTAFVIETSEVYMANSRGEWKKI